MDYKYPGVYIEEPTGQSRTLVGAPTSNTAFLGCFPRGPVGEAFQVDSQSDFRDYSIGTEPYGEDGHQLSQYFLNGGSTAFCIRLVPRNAATATAPLGPDDSGAAASRFQVSAHNPGAWGNKLCVSAVGPAVVNGHTCFSLYVCELDSAGKTVDSEIFLSLSIDAAEPRYCVAVVNQQSALVRLADNGTSLALPQLQPHAPANPAEMQSLQGGSDGAWDQASGELLQSLVAMLDEGSPLASFAPRSVNLLCIPATATLDEQSAATVMGAAGFFCERRQAFYLIDPPTSARVGTPEAMIQWMSTNAAALQSSAAAVYFPRLSVPDLSGSGTRREIGPCGTVAGIYARTDGARGVWKTPAGMEATLVNALPVVLLTDGQNGLLNPIAVNAIRTMPGAGAVCWGARTLQGADRLASIWNYVPVRRTAQFLQTTLETGLQWVTFETNGPNLWAAIRMSMETFLLDLFRKGAFTGSSPKEAFYCRCGPETTTATDIALGIVNITVGFAPLKPAEFVLLQISLVAGPSDTSLP